MRKDFKIGKKINFSELFEEGIIGELSEYLQKMKNYTLLTSYDEITQLKIQEDTMTQRQVVVTTTREMDTSLLQQDIQDLMDIDNFPNQSQLFNLLCTYKKGVGKTLNLLFRKQLLSPEFQKIQ
jgi:predicted mannosyl-3-phosphoglycerate phosphatase (HAD superfamily)